MFFIYTNIQILTLSETVIPSSSIIQVSSTSSIPLNSLPQEPSAQSISHATQPASQGHHTSDRVSNLELENKLLRQEVASLNEELVSVVQRSKEAERGGYNLK